MKCLSAIALLILPIIVTISMLVFDSNNLDDQGLENLAHAYINLRDISYSEKKLNIIENVVKLELEINNILYHRYTEINSSVFWAENAIMMKDGFFMYKAFSEETPK